MQEACDNTNSAAMDGGCCSFIKWVTTGSLKCWIGLVVRLDTAASGCSNGATSASLGYRQMANGWP
jgi:hypothetical protein